MADNLKLGLQNIAKRKSVEKGHVKRQKANLSTLEGLITKLELWKHEICGDMVSSEVKLASKHDYESKMSSLAVR